MATIDRELDEALDVLVGDADTIFQSAKSVAKSMLSGRPYNLNDQAVREWLRMPDTRQLARDAVTALVTQGDIEPFREAAKDSYATASADEGWWGGVVFDEAIGFLALTLDQKLTAEGRLAVQVTNVRADQVVAAIGNLAGQHDAVLQAMQTLVSTETPVDVLDRYVAGVVEEEERSRALEDEGRLARILRITERVRDGDLRRVSPAVAIRAMRLAAQLLARAIRLCEAEQWLAAARDRGANDLSTDEARIAICRKDWTAAARLLGGQRDRRTNGLLLEMIDARDGREAALRFHREHAPAAMIGGFMLPVLTSWLLDDGAEREAEALLAAADDRHVAENITLPFVRARLRIALMVSAAQRPGIYEAAAALPRPDALRDDAEGLRLRTAALKDLRDAEAFARSPSHPRYHQTVEANRLYLQLGATEAERTAATEFLLVKLASSETVLDYAWLALVYGIEFDERHLRSELDRAGALGGWSGGQLMTALQLAMRDPDGADLLAFVQTHRESMVKLLPVELAYGLEVEVLAKRGHILEARSRLGYARPILGTEIVGRLTTIIDEQEGENPIALRLAAYDASGSEADLSFLVQALTDAEDERTADYAVRLWRLRRRTKDAVIACNAMFNASRDDDLDLFLAEIEDLVVAEPRLMQHRAWALYRSGALDDAREMLEPLRAASPDDASLRQLAINVAVEAGDMPRLAAIAATDFERRDHRDAQQLMQAAGLSHATRGELAGELSRAAIAKNPDDPHVLLQAYGLAVRQGLDWCAEESGWLQKAADLSDEAGPIQRANLREILEQRAEGARHAGELDRMVMSGQVPLTIAARPLGTTLSELVLGRLADNRTKPARARLCLPLIAGNRPPMDLSGAKGIGLDPAAIYALHLTGLLRTTLERMPGIVIPAGTLPLLLHDLEQINRPQAARIGQATIIRSLIDAGRLHVFELSDDDSLESLHRRATELDGRLIRASPIIEPASLGENHVDPTPFADRLSSPHALLTALARRGEITSDEQTDALGKLRGYGSPWPDEPEVDLGRPLVLHAVALYGLEYAGMLSPLLRSGANLQIARTLAEQIDAELEQYRRSRALDESIEEVRGQIALALSTGRATLGRFRRTPVEEDGESSRDIEMTPLISLLQDGSVIDVLVSGDRMLNGHQAFTDAVGTSRAVATPLDLIDQLERLGLVSQEQRRSARRRLREAGVALIPVEPDELAAAAMEGDWSHGPGRSLRAIRDSLHLPLLRGAFMMTADLPWLEAVTLAIAIAIRECWARQANVEVAAAASDYLFEMMPALAAWAGTDTSPDIEERSLGTTASFYLLLAMPANVPRDRLDAYKRWFGGVATLRLDGRDRAVARSVEERLRLYLVAQEDMTFGSEATEVPAATVRRTLVGNLPPRLFENVIEHADVRAALGYRTDTVSLAGHEVPFDAMAAFFAASANGSTSDLTDVSGTPFATGSRIEADGTVSATIGRGRGRFMEAGLFASVPEVRRRTLERLLENRTIAPSQAARWHAALTTGSLDIDLFRTLTTDLDATVQAYQSRIRTVAELRYEDLVATDSLYYRNMLDPDGGDGTLPGTLSALVAGHAGMPSVAAAIQSLACLAISPDMPIPPMAMALDDEEVARLVHDLAAAGDPFSVLAAVELAISRSESASCDEAATTILERLLGDGGTFDAAIELFCVTGVLAMNVFDVRGILPDVPIALRRCAALAHAGQMFRALSSFEVVLEDLYDDTLAWAGPRWGLAASADQFEAPVWSRTWLQPAMIGPYLIHRLQLAIDRRPAAGRPDRWSALLNAKVGELVEGGVEIGLGMAGPLDEFGLATPVETVDGAQLADVLRVGTPAEVEAVLFLLVSRHRPLDDTMLLEEHIEAAVLRFEGADRRLTIAAALSAAVRWRLGGVSLRLLDLIHADAERFGFIPVRIAELSVSAAAAQEPERQTEVLGQLLGRIAFGTLTTAQLASVAALLDLLEDLRPDWAVQIERARSACLLSG